eukprot:5479096-Pleurochrysis_carterae.AAC.2
MAGLEAALSACTLDGDDDDDDHVSRVSAESVERRSAARGGSRQGHALSSAAARAAHAAPLGQSGSRSSMRETSSGFSTVGSGRTKRMIGRLRAVPR